MNTIAQIRIIDTETKAFIQDAKYRITTPEGQIIEGITTAEGTACIILKAQDHNFKIEAWHNDYPNVSRLTNIPKTPFLWIWIKLSRISEHNGGLGFNILSSAPCAPESTETPTTPPVPPETDPGPQIIDCVFPTLSLNFISVMSGLASWIGCILHNIITILKWLVDWILHFPDHLDAWISRLFGVDPALPFFDEVLKKIDIWISGKFGVDPALPFWEELVKKAIGWLGGGIDEASRKAIQRLR